MKKIIVAMVSSLLFACSVAQAEPSAADQKWLEVVQKMVEKGQTKLSTPSQERVKLFQTWASQHGLTVVVTKADSNFKIEVTKPVAKN
ncbi:MAG: hypothetical protein ABSD57_04085 [Verrucomicrobiota bacterium]|jgi:hypothetical protein